VAQKFIRLAHNVRRTVAPGGQFLKPELTSKKSRGKFPNRMPYWSVAQCETHREPVAANFLMAAGFETYLPKIKAQSRITPLFPGYLFVKIVDRWWSVNNTIAVIQLLRSGDQPAQLRDEIVSSIKNKERNGLVKLPQPPGLKIGDKVRIVRGSFQDRLGIFDGMSGRDRSHILLELLGRQVRVEIRKIDFAPVVVAA
jgi:transcriptional antiterminator RfaH